jgi:hypothetical protein
MPLEAPDHNWRIVARARKSTLGVGFQLSQTVRTKIRKHEGASVRARCRALKGTRVPMEIYSRNYYAKKSLLRSGFPFRVATSSSVMTVNHFSGEELLQRQIV